MLHTPMAAPPRMSPWIARFRIPVPAGDLHDGRIANPGQQRAHGQTRHVAIRAAAVGRVDRVDIAVEYPRTLVDFLRVCRIRRCQLGGDGELARAQHTFEAPGRGVSRQDGQGIAGNRFILESHGAPPGAASVCPFSRATRNHEERP